MLDDFLAYFYSFNGLCSNYIVLINIKIYHIYFYNFVLKCYGFCGYFINPYLNSFINILCMWLLTFCILIHLFVYINTYLLCYKNSSIKGSLSWSKKPLVNVKVFQNESFNCSINILYKFACFYPLTFVKTILTSTYLNVPE